MVGHPDEKFEGNQLKVKEFKEIFVAQFIVPNSICTLQLWSMTAMNLTQLNTE